MRLAFHGRRDVLVECLGDIDGVRFEVPMGAFYLMLDCREFIDPERSEDGCWRLASHLLKTQHLATIPGKPFGAVGHLRLSFARGEDELREAAGRLAAGLREFPG